MKKKVISIILSVLMILPALTIVSSAGKTDDSYAENWSISSMKWQKSDLSHVNHYINRNGGSNSRATPDGGILCKALSNDEAEGIFSAQSLTSNNKCSLDGLEVKMKFDDFKMNHYGGSSSGIGLLWCTDKVSGEVDGYDSAYAEYCTGTDQVMKLAKGGLMNVIPKGSKALSINIMNPSGQYDNDGTCTASVVRITYYDGSDEWWRGGQYAGKDTYNVGMTWTFMKRSGDAAPLDVSDIDFTDGLTFKFNKDDTLGYKISIIDGTGAVHEYFEKSKVAYFPANAAYSGMSPQYDLDFSGLEGLEGYLTLGTYAAAPEDGNTFTLESINGDAAAAFNGCNHVPAGEVIIDQPCKCTAGSSYRICSVCGKICSIAPIEPEVGHVESDWIIIREPTNAVKGLRIKKCDICGIELAREYIPVIDNPFSDVPEYSWFTEAALYCNEKGYMTGIEDGKFSPDTPLTRAQMVQILAKIADVDLDKIGYTGRFKDVAEDAWYAPAVEWAADKGITSGTGDGKFEPDTYVTREQLVVFLKAFCEMLGRDTSKRMNIEGHPDYSDVSKWAIEAFRWAFSEGFISGSSSFFGILILPKNNATRAQTAVIIKAFTGYSSYSDNLLERYGLKITATAFQNRMPWFDRDFENHSRNPMILIYVDQEEDFVGGLPDMTITVSAHGKHFLFNNKPVSKIDDHYIVYVEFDDFFMQGPVFFEDGETLSVLVNIFVNGEYGNVLLYPTAEVVY